MEILSSCFSLLNYTGGSWGGRWFCCLYTSVCAQGWDPWDQSHGPGGGSWELDFTRGHCKRKESATAGPKASPGQLGRRPGGDLDAFR